MPALFLSANVTDETTGSDGAIDLTVSGGTAAYTYDWDQDVTKFNYGTNTKGLVTIKVLKLRSEHINSVTIDGRSVEFETETVGNDTYTVFSGPSGQHSIEISKGQPLAQVVAPAVVPPKRRITTSPIKARQVNRISATLAN